MLMIQLKYLDYKFDDWKLRLTLIGDGKVLIWDIPLLHKVNGLRDGRFLVFIRGYVRRLLYDLAYATSYDKYEKNVIMQSTWFMEVYPHTKTVWVDDNFIERVNNNYEIM